MDKQIDKQIEDVKKFVRRVLIIHSVLTVALIYVIYFLLIK